MNECEQGRFLEGPWQGHGPGKFFCRSANFPHFDRIFYIYYVWPELARVFLVPVSFGPGTFNGQDPPLNVRFSLICTYEKKTVQMPYINMW
ncbi:hypothetical protein Hanom_Chr06g00519801 [Helianthus anomalus]